MGFFEQGRMQSPELSCIHKHRCTLHRGPRKYENYKEAMQTYKEDPRTSIKMQSSPAFSSSRSMPVLQMVCDGAIVGAPLGAQCREFNQAESRQRRNSCPIALWSDGMAEQAADRPSGEKLPLEVKTDAAEPPA
jgi:hypothetical protein